MTDQKRDILAYNGRRYFIHGVRKPPLFHPSEYGFSPYMASTDCRKGYILHLKLENNLLILHEISINLKTAMIVCGIEPVRLEDAPFSHLYSGLSIHLSFSGQILAIRDIEQMKESNNDSFCLSEIGMEVMFENGKVLSITFLNQTECAEKLMRYRKFP
ncbi:MAG: hypothetical protein GF411_19070 [Candidatus Lokiarchaeota archaeon]|nr:hypothetical protein [Candidatus Lokiarchaeota archaeon]